MQRASSPIQKTDALLPPTAKAVIYQIAKNFILGFADDGAIEKHNLRLLDSLEYAKTETLDAKLEELFG